MMSKHPFARVITALLNLKIKLVCMGTFISLVGATIRVNAIIDAQDRTIHFFSAGFVSHGASINACRFHDPIKFYESLP